MTSREDNIDIKNSVNYSNILIFGIKDAIARYADLLCGVGPVEAPYLVGIREKVNKCVTGLADATNVSNLGILDWCLLVYTELKTEWRDAVDKINQAKSFTGSKFRKEEMEKLVKFLQRASRESVNEATEMAIREQLVNESKGFSLFRGLKQNGLRSIEDDLYEYKVRAKNCTEQADAIYILRCINTRMAILEDYLATTPDINPREQQRWIDLIEQYRELRASVAAKKFGSASKNFNSFLNIDYDALDRLDRPQEAAVNEADASFFDKATIALHIKPKQNLAESCKKGNYPGLLTFVQNCKKMDLLKYLVDDLQTTKAQLTLISKRIKAVEDGKGDPKWEKGIRKLYIDKGVTSEDVAKYIEWLNTTYRTAINDRMKELKKLHESVGIVVKEADEDEKVEEKKEDTPAEDTDEGFEEAPADAEVEEAPAEEEKPEESEEEKKSETENEIDKNLSGSELKSDGGDIYVNCTINK